MESETREASSMSRRDAEEKPRTVSSMPGRPTIREPLDRAMDWPMPAAPRTGRPSFEIMPAAFRMSRLDCLWDGLATSTRAPGSVWAR